MAVFSLILGLGFIASAFMMHLRISTVKYRSECGYAIYKDQMIVVGLVCCGILTVVSGIHNLI